MATAGPVTDRRVRRSTPATGSEVAALDADFACAYEVAVAPADGRSAEEWARAAWEGASAPLRWVIVAGWRLVLGLRLGPRGSPDHILGWRIVERPVDEVVCQASGVLTAINAFRRVDGRFVWSTFARYEGRSGRLIWPPVSVLHRLLVRVALREPHARQ